MIVAITGGNWFHWRFAFS